MVSSPFHGGRCALPLVIIGADFRSPITKQALELRSAITRHDDGAKRRFEHVLMPAVMFERSADSLLRGLMYRTPRWDLLWASRYFRSGIFCSLGNFRKRRCCCCITGRPPRMLRHWSRCKAGFRLWHPSQLGLRQFAFCKLHCHNALDVRVDFFGLVSNVIYRGQFQDLCSPALEGPGFAVFKPRITRSIM